MKKLSFILLVAVATVGIACKSKSKQSDTSNASGEKTLTIDFISKGGGIDHASFKELEVLLSDTGSIDCKYDKSLNKWGREGERQYCLTFPDTRCYNKTYAKVITLLDGKPLVRIKPDGVCRK